MFPLLPAVSNLLESICSKSGTQDCEGSPDTQPLRLGPAWSPHLCTFEPGRKSSDITVRVYQWLMEVPKKIVGKSAGFSAWNLGRESHTRHTMCYNLSWHCSPLYPAFLHAVSWQRGLFGNSSFTDSSFLVSCRIASWWILFQNNLDILLDYPFG